MSNSHRQGSRKSQHRNWNILTRRKAGLDPVVAAENWHEMRKKQIPVELARLDADLEAIDQKLSEFFGGPDLRLLAFCDRGAAGFAILDPEKAEVLRFLDRQKGDVMRRRGQLLDERAHYY